jgi:hypothetical protein
VSMKRVYLAIDAHARHCVLGSMNTRGKLLRTRTFVTGETELILHIQAIDARTPLQPETRPRTHKDAFC